MLVMSCNFKSTKVLELGSCAFRQPNAAFNRQDAGDNSSRCAKNHGYFLTAKFWFGCNNLDDKSWVQDFGGFKPIKETFKHQFDHTTCLAFDDPLLPLFQQLHDAGGLDLRVMPKGTGIECISEWCYEKMQEFVQKQNNGRTWVERVEVFEHGANSAIYEPSHVQISSVFHSEGITESSSYAITVSPEDLPEQITAIAMPNVAVTPLDQEPQHNPRAASVGTHTTTGKGDWFKGTTWAKQ